jgi:hypothetical protein
VLSTARKEVAESATTSWKEKAAPLAGGVTALQEPPALVESSSAPPLSAARKVTALALARPVKAKEPAGTVASPQLRPLSMESSSCPLLSAATEVLHMGEGEPEEEEELTRELEGCAVLVPLWLGEEDTEREREGELEEEREMLLVAL